MLSQLLPEVEMVERDSESKLMLTVELVNKTDSSSVNVMEVNEYIVRYDGDLSMIVYYDKSGNVIQSYCGYVDDSELLGDIINRLLYTYYKKWY